MKTLYIEQEKSSELIKLMSNSTKVIVFVLLSYTVSYLIQGVIWLTGGVKAGHAGLLISLLTLTPALVSFVLMWLTQSDFDKVGWQIGNIQYLLYGIFIPILYTFIQVVVATGLGLGKSKLFTLDNGRILLGKQSVFILNVNPQSIPLFILNICLTVIVNSLVLGFIIWGEEVGWRGYLQPKLIDQFGLTKGVILLGIIWAFWHLPIWLMGYNSTEYNPLIGAILIYPITGIALSFILAWLRLSSGSIWSAVLAHSSNNACSVLTTSESWFAANPILRDVVWAIVMVALGVLFHFLTRFAQFEQNMPRQ